MDLTLVSYYGSDPLRDGLIMALFLAPFVPIVARSPHRDKILAVVAALFTLVMLGTLIEMLQWFADDLPFLAQATAVLATLLIAANLRRNRLVTLASKRVC